MSRVAATILIISTCVYAQDSDRRSEIIRALQCDGGDSRTIDLATIEKKYKNLAQGLARDMARFPKKALGKIHDGFDAGLPDPVRKETRTYKPPTPLPPKLHGSTAYVVTIDKSGVLAGLPDGKRARTDVVLVSRAARLRDCSQISPVTLLTREMASALGIRTSRCRLVVSEDGKSIEIMEGHQP